MTHNLIIHLLADGAIIPLVLIAGYVLVFRLPKGQRWQAYCRILLAGLTSYMVAQFIASVYQPEFERPFQLLGAQAGALYLNNPGFPSDHTLFATVITAAVWFETRMKKTTILLAILVLLIAVGRVLALVHTPLDVAGGIVIGLVGALWYFNKPGGQKRVSHGKISR